MPQKVTAGEPTSGSQLSPTQLAAADALVVGSTVTDAAGLAGVARETVHRWLREDDLFQAELNRKRLELRDAAERRLLAVAEKASQNLSRAVEEGNLQASVVVLKGLGFMSGERPSVGPVDVADVRMEADIAEASRQERQLFRGLLTSRV